MGKPPARPRRSRVARGNHAGDGVQCHAQPCRRTRPATSDGSKDADPVLPPSPKRLTRHADAPSSGLRVIKTPPALSTATHSDRDAHETPFRAWPPSTRRVLQRGARPAGLEEVSTSPAVSTATHRETDGHDTPASSATPEAVWPRLTCTVAHADANGLREAVIRPPLPTATHNLAEGHDTDANENVEPNGGPSSTSTGADHVSLTDASAAPPAASRTRALR